MAALRTAKTAPNPCGIRRAVAHMKIWIV